MSKEKLWIYHYSARTRMPNGEDHIIDGIAGCFRPILDAESYDDLRTTICGEKYDKSKVAITSLTLLKSP